MTSRRRSRRRLPRASARRLVWRVLYFPLFYYVFLSFARSFCLSFFFRTGPVGGVRIVAVGGGCNKVSARSAASSARGLSLEERRRGPRRRQDARRALRAAQLEKALVRAAGEFFVSLHFASLRFTSLRFAWVAAVGRAMSSERAARRRGDGALSVDAHCVPRGVDSTKVVSRVARRVCCRACRPVWIFRGRAHRLVRADGSRGSDHYRRVHPTK